MRKDYEERLDELAESKRQALREMNSMFEARLEEKDLMLQEVLLGTSRSKTNKAPPMYIETSNLWRQALLIIIVSAYLYEGTRTQQNETLGIM